MTTEELVAAAQARADERRDVEGRSKESQQNALANAAS
jgi:hypothetical protein